VTEMARTFHKVMGKRTPVVHVAMTDSNDEIHEFRFDLRNFDPLAPLDSQ